MKTIRVNRAHKKAYMLGTAMMFFVLVTVAGGAMLSMSQINRMAQVRRGADVRLLLAAEAGIESVRGRFTLVAGVQDDWSTLVPGPGWTNLGGQMNINGIQVQAQGRPIGDPSTPQARIRAIAYGTNTNRVVEYHIQAANFADYALYFGATNTVGIGENFKMVGNFYSKGSVNLSNRSGIEFFGDVDSSEKVLNYTDYAYNFKKGFTRYAPVVTIPPSAYGLDVMRSAAEASGTLFYSNTLSIKLQGQQFIRTFEYRFKGTGSNYKHNDHMVMTEVLDIPDNSVIYIDSGKAPTGVDTYSFQSNRANQASNGNLGLEGTLIWKRVTIACEHEIDITNNVSYQTLLNTPNYRRFTEKKSNAATNYREMLGVLSATHINFMCPDWNDLPSSSKVINDATRNPPDIGHEYYQYSLDGVFMGVESAKRGKNGNSNNRELWVCGGIINGNHPNTELSGNYDRRNYDTDYRLQKTTPPYFLKAYGESANMIIGTWRTYKV